MSGVHRSSGLRSVSRRRVVLPLIPVAMALGAIVGLTVSGNMPGMGSSADATSASLTAASPPNGRVADLAEVDPRDPTGKPIRLFQGAGGAANSMNCSLIVPADPLSAQGLATPWQLADGCSEANPNESAFVEATILAPNGHLSVYDPLVVTAGTTPAVTPVPPAIAAGSQVIIDTGFNGNNLVLEGRGAVQGNCIDAFGHSIIAQTAACNAQAFYKDANAQIAAGTLKIPAVGTGKDGRTCPTTRDFSLIDQDQSDNVLSVYLANANGQTAQATPDNVDTMGGSTVVTNGSDDGLLGHFVDAALGCKRFAVPDPTSPGGADDSQALNELSARQNQANPVALLPVSDPQLLLNGQFNKGKTNTYRALTDQSPLPSTASAIKNAALYCQQMVNLAPFRLQADMGLESGFQSPVPALGNNLATLMGARLSASFTNLNCGMFALKNPVTLALNGAGVAIAVTYDTSQQVARIPASVPPIGGGPSPSPTPTASSSGGPSPTPSATAPSPSPSATKPSSTPSPTPSSSWPGY